VPTPGEPPCPRQLSTLTDTLVAVHGQSDQHRLLRLEAQRDALDRFAGEPVTIPAQDYADAYRRLRAVEHELDEVVRSARERPAKRTSCGTA
jgi:DNA repair protein RecN (Recombination protein N)